MTTTVNAALLQNEFQDSRISYAIAEIVLDSGINLLNTFGAGLSNLTGIAGSKTGDYPSAEAGAIMAIARQIYAKHYMNAPSTSSSTLGPAGVSYSGDYELLNYAKKLADALQSSTSVDPPIYVANDPLPNE